MSWGKLYQKQVDQKTLKEKVFECCDYKEKITRDRVREQTGGSDDDRDLSQYILEWKLDLENGLLVSTKSNFSQKYQ